MAINLTNRATLMKTLPHGGSVVEVGVEHGAFSETIRAFNAPKQLYLVDAWSAQPGTDWSEKDPCARDDHDANYAEVQNKFGQDASVTIIRSLSGPAAATFEDGSLDIVYIDADHMNAKADIAAYWPKVKPGGWLCGHDYALCDWITVKTDVDAFVRETGLPLLVTRETWPSWAIRKPGGACDEVVAPFSDVSLVVTVYPEYSHLLPGALAALEQHWPEHPPLTVSANKVLSLHERMRLDVESVSSEFVVVMHEDYWLCDNVKDGLFRDCLGKLKADASVACCSLTWEPCDVGIYRHQKQAYFVGVSRRRVAAFRVLPKAWDYVINFQARIWRRDVLLGVLRRIPANTSNATLEPTASKIFRRMYPRSIALTYAFTTPPKPSTFVDATSKAAWIVPYNNMIHAGAPRWK